MRAVFDTVVFVRALINPHGRWGLLLFQLCDRYTLVLSPAIIREILDVLYRSSLRDRFPQIDEIAIDRVLALFENADVVEPGFDVRICRDPNDDKFFACALASDARFIVSEDADILAVEEVDGIRTMTAAEFMDIIGG